MKFSLGDKGADSVNAGIGSIFKALTQAPILRDQMAQQTALRNAQTYNANMSGNKYGSEAAANEYTLGRRKAVPDMIAADPNMPAYLQQALKLFDLTGDTNAERVAKSSGEFQTQGIRDQAVKNVGDIDTMNRYNTLSKPGETYEPFDNVGNTGRGFNKATGFGKIIDSALAAGHDRKVQSEFDENRASAGKSNAEAGLTNAKLKHFTEKGSLPGTGAEGSEGALSTNILNTIRIPTLDAKGRPVRNPMTGEIETHIDPQAQNQFYSWAVANNRKPTAAAFAQWEASGRPTGGKAAPAKSAAPTAPASTIRKPTLEQFLAAARQANPSATDDQLKAYYAQKYGNQ
jgi:hypothetical protein